MGFLCLEATLVVSDYNNGNLKLHKEMGLLCLEATLVVSD